MTLLITITPPPAARRASTFPSPSPLGIGICTCTFSVYAPNNRRKANCSSELITSPFLYCGSQQCKRVTFQPLSAQKLKAPQPTHTDHCSVISYSKVPRTDIPPACHHPHSYDSPRWRALTSTSVPPPSKPQSHTKINNSSPDRLPCCCHAGDLVHTSLVLFLPPQEKLQIDPQDLTLCPYFSWAAAASLCK